MLKKVLAATVLAVFMGFASQAYAGGTCADSTECDGDLICDKDIGECVDAGGDDTTVDDTTVDDTTLDDTTVDDTTFDDTTVVDDGGCSVSKNSSSNAGSAGLLGLALLGLVGLLRRRK
jgi:uncharacterized protein (TIGR03382 family)